MKVMKLNEGSIVYPLHIVQFTCLGEITNSHVPDIQCILQQGIVPYIQCIRMEHRDDESKSDSVVATADGERNNTAIVVLDLLKFIEILPSGGFARKYVCNIFTMLDIKSLGAFINTSFLKLFCRRTQK